MKLFVAALAAFLSLGAMDAEAARRLGGGRSIGKQSPSVMQRDAARPAPATPAQQQPAAQPAPGNQAAPTNQAAPAQAAPAQAARPAQAAPAPAPRRPWGAMLGGLAAGLGLAWLANALGFGPAMANMLLVLLLAVVAFAVIRMLVRGRRGPAMAGAGAPFPNDVAREPPQYNPAKVGNDASARPWERSSMAFDASKAAGTGLQIGSALPGPSPAVPGSFDAAGFVATAKRNFMTLQEAWDRADIATLRSMMTDGMLREIRSQLAEREKHLGGEQNQTDVVMLEAQLLGIEDLGNDYMASVEFSGMIREQPSAGPSPFREVWNMTKPKDGTTGWLVAGVQALA